MTRSLKEFEIAMYEDRKAYEDYLMKEILSKPIIGMPKDEARIACFTSTSESDKGVEDWVWMTGYKGTDKDMKCRDYQFELGKQFDMPDGEDIVLCSSGFHLCNKLSNVFKYYKPKNGNRFFEVKALVRRYNKNGYYTFEHLYDKMTSKSIQFVRELTADEIFKEIKDARTNDWTTEQKELALKTSIDDVDRSVKVQKLVGLGYSEAFATYACDKRGYEIACAMGSMPDVSMDVKVLAIMMDIR